jgi:cytochrome c-type biogenesis protein CcmH/NrfG
VGEAIAAYRQAVERSPDEESALGSLIFALEVADRAGEAPDLAATEQARDPESATLALRRADAVWVSGGGIETAIRILEEARPSVREADRYRIDLELGRLYWVRGDADAARRAYRAVLDYQADSPEGLWGLAAAEALGESWDAAWAAYAEAVRLRTGVVDLRVDFARDLMRAGLRDRAGEQIREALLLDATDPGVRSLGAWLALEEGRTGDAERESRAVLAEYPWSDMGRIVLARAQDAQGDRRAARETLAPLRTRVEAEKPPEYLFRPRWGRYEQIHILPAVERELITLGASKR